MTTVIVAPELRPYFAWKFEVYPDFRDRIQRRRRIVALFRPVSLLVTPSYEKLKDVRPLMDRLFMFSHPGASRLRVSITPAAASACPRSRGP